MILKKEQWNDNKNIALISCFGNLVKDLQQYETVKGTLGQQKKAIDKKSQLYNIQKQDINLVNVEIQNILGKQKGNNNKMEVVDENNNDVKQERIYQQQLAVTTKENLVMLLMIITSILLQKYYKI